MSWNGTAAVDGATNVRTLLRTAFVSLVGPIVFACSPTIESDGVSIANGNLYIRGIIDDQTAADVTVSLLRKMDTVVVDSAGGSESAAISIAKKIAGVPNLTLVVDGACLSACALYLFPSARRKVISHNAVVGCHHGSISLTMVDPGAFGAPFSKEELALADSARDLYRTLGVSADFAVACLYRVAPYCYALNPNSDKIVRTAYEFWLPTAEDLRGFGIQNVSGAPDDHAEVVRLMKVSGIFGPPDLMNPDEVRVAKYTFRFASYSCAHLQGRGGG